ncbi:ERI1 exoribonuclease 2 [Mugil cephalus]|uniref:ERI1 exoribonuclease 2 n=1 Tax=Mugil cephalus TaxID=48193 RepID=UPI001FB726C4|nr:ERI1 exoribonuclease 2 [Mugil cephalus]
MSTKKLAKELGLVRQRSQSTSGSKKSVVSNQIFSYLIVIDFESTCWREKNNYGQEIIEFPAVLLNTSTGEVESEFHTYVQPQEHPILSEFCTELTGITQMQVEAGIPLRICLSQFSRWLQNLQLEMGVVFPGKQQKSSAPLPSQKLCTFLTWSDWDLGVCLQYECKRKQLHKPDVLNNWIDLRNTYRVFYNRKPKGLNGALQDLGIQFSGREHSGLDDSRNTARLAAKMMRDGCVMKITRSLERTPFMAKPMSGNTSCPANNMKENHNTNKMENSITKRSKIPLRVGQKQSCSKDVTTHIDTKEHPGPGQGSVQICQNVISPKTLLSSSTAPLRGHDRRPVTAEAAAGLFSSVMTNRTSPQIDNKSLVRHRDAAVSCYSNLPQPNQVSTTGTALGLMEEGDSADILTETEERCGSYDDVLLEGDEVVNETERECGDVLVSDFDGGCYEWDESDGSHSSGAHLTLEGNIRVSTGNNVKVQNINRKSTKMSRLGSVNVSNHVQHSTNSGSNAHFAVPKTVNKSNCNKTEHKASLLLEEKSDGPHKNCKTNTPSPLGTKPFVPVKTSTPNTSSVKPQPVITQHIKHKDTLKSPFTIYKEPGKQVAEASRLPARSSLHTPNNVLSSLSTNNISCSNRPSVSLMMRGAPKITAPLCACGRRAKRQVVSNGGPNHGRGFYCCPGRVEKGCEFFKWESALTKSTPAAGSSVSLCQISSTLHHRPPNRSLMRKSC